MHNWNKRNWKNVKNADLWKQLWELEFKLNVEAVWIKGHDGHLENERCDEVSE
jgi:ribonuclease HI